ncbi:uncharacterized protein PAC_10199 [Phialocephala subalpina]|uniref:Uncharacterized protein n=1 Tax=Phialocephala subalpina TaxID=576137 RepID=A0A1L7X5K6_9HELO|nr:uncharacterized protein PAC_10199 [Phialocephala subalpina]
MNPTPTPNPQALTSNPDNSKNSSTGVDYEPHPESSISLSAERQKIVDSIMRLYSGSASEGDMQVYAEKAIYDDPWSYCDTRYKIAGQWYGIPKIMATSHTLSTEVVSSTSDEIVFKLRQEYKPKLSPASKAVNSLVSLKLEKDGAGAEKVVHHKDMWNEKDYSHECLSKVFKTLNGDHLTKITQPPKSL